MQQLNRFLWGPTPQEKVRKWQAQLKKEQRALEREIHHLDLANSKVKAEVKKLAQRGDAKNAKLLAREVVRSNRQKQRMQTSKAQLNSIHMQLGHQLGAFISLSGSLLPARLTHAPPSDGQSDGDAPGVNRDHEGVQLAHQAAPTVQHDARNECRNDEGAPILTLHALLTSF